MQQSSESWVEQQALNDQLASYSLALYRKLWSLQGPLARLFQDSKVIAHIYYNIVNGTSESPLLQNLKTNEVSSIKTEHADRELILKKLKELSENRELSEEDKKSLESQYKYELNKLDIAISNRESLLDLARAPSDFQFLNMAYGMDLYLESLKDNFQAELTPYYAYNDLWSSVEDYLKNQPNLTAQEKLILDIYKLNAKVAGELKAFQQTLKIENMDKMSLVKTPKQSYYFALAQRCDDLLNVSRPNFGKPPDIVNPDNPVVLDIIQYMREEAAQELTIIYKHLLETKAPEAQTLRGYFNQRNFLNQTQEALLRKFLPVTKTPTENLPLREALLVIIKERSDHYQKFAQAVLDFIDGKINPHDFQKKLIEFSAERNLITSKRETSVLDSMSHKVSTFFSGEKTDYQARFTALNKFQSVFISQLYDLEGDHKPTNLPKM